MRRHGGPDFRFVRARKALDALEALGHHRDAVILVGAQAIYLNVGEATEALSSFTADADLALNPELLASEPALEQVLAASGFERRGQPGLWFNPNGVEVDLLVPASIAGPGRRGVDLGKGHERSTARRVAGLEAALVDRQPVELHALDEEDQRFFVIPVAGPAALLVAKLYKIADRDEETPDRLKNKDASDLLLLLRRTRTDELASSLQALSRDARVGPTIGVALGHLKELFTFPDAPGAKLLRDAVVGVEDQDTAAASCVSLANDLLVEMGK